jgi:SAM-dependent methyltransferase
MRSGGASYEADVRQTLENRGRLRSNPNLMYWYSELYARQFADEAGLQGKRVLEIGSGSSPLKMFQPGVITSDVLALDYLDMTLDCHEIGSSPAIPDGSLDIITMTNVLHHLRDPIAFLQGATRKLARGGRIYMAEPFFSALSYPMYRLLHHEPVDFSIQRPVLARIDGPLSSSNQAMPHMIFFSRPDWLAELSASYDIPQTRLTFFSAISYPLTGGVSRTFPLPQLLYRFLFRVDRVAADMAPRLFASFFIARLVAK